MKLKILIVDDEIIQLKLLAKVIQSLKPEYEVSFTNSSTEALKMLSLHQYDILITDIKMPKMDGIELIKSLRETIHNDDIKIIILSGYSEFEYARSAIKYNVSDYLLKPIEKQNLIDILNSIERSINNNQVEIIDSSTPLIKEYALYKLLTAGSISEADNAVLEKGFPSGVRACIIITSVVEETSITKTSIESFNDYVKKKYTDSITTCLSNDKIVTVIPCTITRSYDSIVSDLQSNVSKSRNYGLCFVVALSYNIKNIYEEYSNALEYLNCLRFLGTFPPLVNMTSVQDVDSAQLLSGDLEKHILSLNQEKTENFLNFISNELHNKIFNIERLKSCFADIIRLCADKYSNKFLTTDLLQELCYKYSKQIYNANSFTKIKEALQNFICDIISLNSTTEGINASQNYKLYIELNYHDPNFSLNQIATYFNYNPSYFSDLFVKMFGVTFSKYLTAYRMSQACNLLKTTNKKIYEIAHEVGIQSDSYFVKTFKEYYNMSPWKYRQFIKGNPKS